MSYGPQWEDRDIYDEVIEERDNLQARLTVCNEERREQDRELVLERRISVSYQAERDRLKDQLEQVWGERNVLKDQLAKSEQAREDAIIERSAEIGRLKDQLTTAYQLNMKDEVDRLKGQIEKYQAHIRSESSRLAQIDADRERLKRNHEACEEDCDDVLRRLRAVIDEFFCGNVPHGLQEALEGEWSGHPSPTRRSE